MNEYTPEETARLLAELVAEMRRTAAALESIEKTLQGIDSSLMTLSYSR